MDRVLLYCFYALLLCLSAHGVHRALLLLRLLRRGRKGWPLPPLRDRDCPVVTVQLPIYNEFYVAERLLAHAAALDWPRDRLEIQVLDDSTDETAGILARKTRELRDRGLRIHHARRKERKGFKAGALHLGLLGGEGLPPARGEFLAVFDADFLPPRDFLRRTIPPLLAQEDLALVQARWAHMNRRHSLLTRLQALFLDAHFAVEHEARQRAGHFLNFNGTAGVWRRSAIEAAGGWSHDTLTEDLDLSFRAQMKGYRFAYAHDLPVPSELPVEMNAFKSQQHRWAKGSIETAIKLLPGLLRQRGIRLSTRLEGAFHLCNNFAYLVMFLVTLLALPLALTLGPSPHSLAAWLDRLVLGLGLLPVLLYFLLGQLRTGRSLVGSLALLPAALALGVGLSLNNSRAILEALLGSRSPFLRTPKYHVQRLCDTWLGKRYSVSRGLWPLLEVGMGLACAWASWTTFQKGLPTLACFMLLFTTGYLYIGLSSLLPSLFERLRSLLAHPRLVPDPGTP